MFERDVIMEAKEVLDLCRSAGLTLAAAESCTGGLFTACLTDIAGSSAVVERGFVTYSNAAKGELLGVPADMIEAHGAVSEQVARAMAEGALDRSRADIAVSITGVAGPGGGSEEKPVGLVHVACARREQLTDHRRMLFGDQGRTRIRVLSVRTAFVLIKGQIGRPSLA